MAKKLEKGQDAQRSKTVTLKHKHAKPYRRRHIGVLILLIVAAAIVLSFIVQYGIRIIASTASSNSFMSDLFKTEQADSLKVQSSNGFSLDVDQKKFYASAIDGTNGDLFIGDDLSVNRAYTTVRVSPSEIDTRAAQSNFTLTYHPETTYKEGEAPSLETIEIMALNDGLITLDAFTRTTSESMTIGGQDFMKTTWVLKDAQSSFKIRSELQTYAGIVNNHPVTIVINYGLGASTSDDLYGSVMSSLYFGQANQAYVQPTDKTIVAQRASRTVLDTLLMSQFAGAVSSGTDIANSEKVAAQYSPAVVRVFNVYKTDIAVDNKFKFNVDLAGGTGTGFIVSQDGYVATNGHVGSLDLKGTVIATALSQAQKGQPQYFNYLTSISGLTDSDIAGLSAEVQMGVIVDGLYKIPDSKFVAQNLTQSLLVTTTEQQPNINDILAKLKMSEPYAPTNTIKSAKFVADNYRKLDGPIGGMDYFRKSDVALLKIEGTGYPVAKLGDISMATQGANLLIMGYPAAANSELVEASTTPVSLTSSKVSAVKTLAQSNHKVIETDAAISPGNSGGPAFLETGEVVGLATYASTGNSSINYIRDIADLKQLAKDSAITLDTESVTQSEWDQGLALFYEARYTKSLEHFEKVKALYPNHPKVAEFISAAETRIENGEDIQDFPILWVSIAGGVLLLGVVITIVLIVHHKKKHSVYTAGVAQGTVTPTAPGAQPQIVTVAPTVAQPGVYPAVPPIDSSQSGQPQSFQPTQYNQPVQPPQPWVIPENQDPPRQP